MSASPLPHARFDDLKTAQDTLALEAEAISALSNSLGDAFVRAVDLFFETPGRVVVSGVGKSGHIGRKMAATFASTGQPSFFLHAAEAGHGDLGMVTNQDALLLLSYSGEALELRALVDYAHRLALPVVSITGKEKSTLALQATISLLLPPLTEACPMGLAPTTSTTVTLALGDALAMVLLKRRGFSPHDFGNLHPSGRLGAQLRRVRDVMHRGDRLPLLSETAQMGDALCQMTSKGFGCVGIIDASRRIVGVITDGDLRRHMGPKLLSQSVTEIMTHHPVCLSENHLMSDALALMEKKTITFLFITDCEERVSGLIHIHDCLRQNVV